MLNVRQNFAYICIVLVSAQIIVLISVLIIYISNTNDIITGIKEHRKYISVVYRDTNKEYLTKKLLLLIEDALLILKTFDNVQTWGLENNNYDDIIFESSQTNDNFSGPWYLEEDKINTYLKGVYMNPGSPSTDDTINYLSQLAVVQPLIENLFRKYYKWKDKIYLPINYAYFAFDETGLFYKFPRLFASYFLNKDKVYTGCEYYKSEPTVYDPRCRPFYTQAKESDSNIIITQPYKFATGDYGNDICFKKKNDKEELVYVFCMVFSFHDYYILQNNVNKTLESLETTQYIAYFNKTHPNTSLKIVFNTKYKPTDITCVDNTVNNKEYFCEPINFFDIYYHRELSILYENLTHQIADDTTRNNAYIEQYLILQKSFNESIYNKIVDILTIPNLNELMNITTSNINEKDESEYSFTSNVNVTIDYTSNIKFNIKENDNKETFYVYPLIEGFNFDGQYKITNTNDYYYFLIVQTKGTGDKNTKSSFTFVILCEFFLFLFYLLFLNCLIWCLFSFIYYYFLKGFLLPLKKIQKLYLQIAKLSSVTADNAYKSINSNSKKKKKQDLESKNILSVLDNFKMTFIQKIAEISQIEKHEEISNALVTLKAISLIINFRGNSIEYENIEDDKDWTKMESFYEAIQFLSECFFSKYTNKENIDFPLVKLVLEKLFISLIREYNEAQKPYKKSKKNNTKNKNKKKYEITEEDIDNSYFKIKTAIRRAKIELDSIYRGSEDSKIIDQTRDDLLTLSILEENINYKFSLFKGMLFDEYLIGIYEEKCLSNINIDKEERNLISELRKKELKEEKKKSIFIDPKILINEIKENADKKTDANNNFNYSKSEDDLGDEIKIIMNTIIEYFENYLIIKKHNMQEKSTIQKIKEVSALYNSNNNINNLSNSIVNENSFDNILHKSRVTDMRDILQEISIELYLSKLYIISDEEQKGIYEYENALNLLNSFEKKIKLYKSNIQSKWKTTNFALLTINTIFYEKLLVIFSLLCEKFYQTKNEMFININLLDLSPLYTKTTRNITLVKLINLLSIEQKKLMTSSNKNFRMYKALVSDDYYIDVQRSLFKLFSMQNATDDTNHIHKNILFVFDMDNKYIKDSVFKNILFHYFDNFNLTHNTSKKNMFSFYCSAFGNKLFLESLPNFDDEKYKGLNFTRKYMEKIGDKGTRRRSSTISVNTYEEEDLNKLQDEKIDNFFSFIRDYKKRSILGMKKDNVHRADKAIYHAALFGINEENKPYKNKQKYMKSGDYIKEANYLILMTTLSSKFTDNKMNWKVMADLFYEKKYTVIIIISYDPDIEDKNNKEIREKIENYQKFIKNYVIDGQLFIMRSLTLLKYILNSVFPLNFNEFNQDIVKHYLCSLENLEN